MPNWVYNKMTINGSKEELLAFMNKASQQHETRWLSEQWIRNEDGTNTKVPDEERKIEIELSEASDLSFWNFIKPNQELIDSGEYFGTKGWSEGKELGNTEGNWYQWNIANWGVKWNASDVYCEGETTDGEIIYNYQTPWSIPMPVMLAMTEQHPNLDFHWWCEEEQGWGGDYAGKGGEFYTNYEWEIPESHADYVAKDDEDGCVCRRDYDEEDWYSDCPRDVNDFLLVVTKTYKVRTDTAENAWALVQENGNDPDELMEFVEGTMNSYVIDEDGKRIYPTLDDNA
jgi:hypothetical protein